VAGRGHDGIRDTHSGSDGGYRFIHLGGRPAARGITHPADTARDMLMSAFGTKRTCQLRQRMSALGGKADIGLGHSEMSAFDPKRTSLSAVLTTSSLPV
jgi:hypothetical protein